MYVYDVHLLPPSSSPTALPEMYACIAPAPAPAYAYKYRFPAYAGTVALNVMQCEFGSAIFDAYSLVPNKFT